MILIWMRAPRVGNIFYSHGLGVTRETPCAMCSLWRSDSRMLKNTSSGGVSRRYGNLNGALPKENTLKQQCMSPNSCSHIGL